MNFICAAFDVSNTWFDFNFLYLASRYRRLAKKNSWIDVSSNSTFIVIQIENPSKCAFGISESSTTKTKNWDEHSFIPRLFIDALTCVCVDVCMYKLFAKKKLLHWMFADIRCCCHCRAVERENEQKSRTTTPIIFAVFFLCCVLLRELCVHKQYIRRDICYTRYAHTFNAMLLCFFYWVIVNYFKHFALHCFHCLIRMNEVISHLGFNLFILIFFSCFFFLLLLLCALPQRNIYAAPLFSMLFINENKYFALVFPVCVCERVCVCVCVTRCLLADGAIKICFSTR